MPFGFGFGLPRGSAGAVAPPAPPIIAWTVADSTNNTYFVNKTAVDSTNTLYSVGTTVLTSTGSSYTPI